MYQVGHVYMAGNPGAFRITPSSHAVMSASAIAEPIATMRPAFEYRVPALHKTSMQRMNTYPQMTIARAGVIPFGAHNGAEFSPFLIELCRASMRRFRRDADRTV